MVGEARHELALHATRGQSGLPDDVGPGAGGVGEWTVGSVRGEVEGICQDLLYGRPGASRRSLPIGKEARGGERAYGGGGARGRMVNDAREIVAE